MSSIPMEVTLHQRFQALSKNLGSSIGLLQIGNEQLGIVYVTPESSLHLFLLELGIQSTVREQFKSRMPDALLLENAIAATEDEIANLPKIRGPVPWLICQNPLVREIALRSGLSDAQKIHLPLEVVELCFNRLANVAMGSTTGYEQLPDDPAFAATLLILREFMHHQHFPSITWMAED